MNKLYSMTIKTNVMRQIFTHTVLLALSLLLSTNLLSQCQPDGMDPGLSGMVYQPDEIEVGTIGEVEIGWQIIDSDLSGTVPPGSWGIIVEFPMTGEYVFSSVSDPGLFTWGGYDPVTKTITGINNVTMTFDPFGPGGLLNYTGSIFMEVEGVIPTNGAKPLSYSTIIIVPDNEGGCEQAFENETADDEKSAGIAVTGPLPIELLSFDAIKSGETVITSWVTLNELNNAYFEVERSEDGKEFNTISEEISGAGTTIEKQNYSWVDKRPLVGVNYYRLKQVDFDAGYTYSRVRSVVFEGRDVAMRLYPNPARNEVTLSTGVKKGEVTLLIYGPNGQLVSNQRYEPGDWKTSTRLDLENMVEGMYMLKIIEEYKTETARFVKVN